MTDVPSPPTKTFSSPSPFKNPDGSEDRPKYDKKRLFLGLQRHFILISVFAAVAALFGLLLGHRLQQSYTADAVVLYDSGERAFLQNTRPFPAKQLSLPTVLDMILLPANIEAVKKNLGLNLESAEIRSMFSIPLPKGNSNFIHVMAKSSNPQLSLDLANTLARISVKASQDYARKQLEEALVAYEQELRSIKLTEENQKALLQKFKSENAYFDMKPDETLFLAKLQEARDLRDKTVLEYKGLQIQYQTLKKKMSETPEYVPATGRWGESPLHMRIANMEATLAEARSKYTKNNPKLLQLEEEVDQLVKKSQDQLKSVDASGLQETNEFRQKLELELTQLQGKMKSARRAKVDLEASVKTLEEKLALLPSQQVELLSLFQAAEITKERLKEANKTVDYMRQQARIPSGNLELYEMAASAKTFDDTFLLNLFPVLGLFFGAGLGVFCALLLEMNDNKIRTAKECQLYYNVPCVETIPKLGFFLRPRAYDKFVFFIRNIADHIDRVSKEKKLPSHKMVVFASSISGEGKSFLSSLTAEYYARLHKKVLLVEADSQKHSLLDPVEHSHSLGDYLTQGGEIDSLVQKGNYDRLMLNEKDAHLKELMKLPKMKDFWESLRAQYEIIIVDAPAILEEDYGLDLCQEGDFSLLVVGSSIVDKTMIDETLDILAPCLKKVSGILLNAIDKTYISSRRLSLETKRAKGGFLSYLYDICFARK